MIFTSLKFLTFAVLTLVGYFALPKKLRWIWLTALSVYFYLCVGLKYGVFLLVSLLSVWLCGLYVKKGRWVLVLTLLVNLGLLAVLKYAAFAVTNLNRLPFVAIPVPEFVAPLGMSFYTFLSVSYIMDVYRELSEPQKNPLKLLLYLSFFPHITQGPIDRYETLAPQLFEGHSFDYARCAVGLRRFHPHCQSRGRGHYECQGTQDHERLSVEVFIDMFLRRHRNGSWRQKSKKDKTEFYYLPFLPF